MNIARGAGEPKTGPSSQGIPSRSAAAGQNLAAAKGEGLPVRPKSASNPNPIRLLANYFSLKLGEDPLTVYKYTFNVLGSEGQELRGATAKNIFKSALTELKAKPHRYATDFQQQIVTLDLLKVPKKALVKAPEKAPQVAPEKVPDETSDKRRRIYLHRSTIVFESFLELQLDASVLPSPSPDVIDCLNLIVGQWAREKTEIAAIGRHKFFPNFSGNRFETDMPESLSVVRGFFQSVRPADGKLFLNLNSTFGVFRPRGNIGALYADLDKKYKFNNSGRKIEVLTKLHGSISKARVTYNNPKDTKPPRTVNIAGFARKNDSVRENPNKDKSNKDEKGSWIAEDFPRPHQVRFWFKGGQTEEYRTVLQHYESKSGGLPNDAKSSPLINIGTPSRPEHVPSRFCELEWGQQLKRKVTEIPGLDRKKLEELNKFTCRRPNDSQNWIESAHELHYLSLDADLNNKVLKSFGASVGKQLVEVSGRKLESPEIRYSDGKSKVTGASWYPKRLSKAVALKKWTWKYLAEDSQITDLVSGGIEEFRKRLKGRCGQSSNPISIPSHIDKDLSRGLSQGVEPLSNFLEWAHGNLDLIVLVFPSRVSAEIYHAVKFLGDVRHGVHTSCILEDKFKRKDKKTKELLWDYSYFDNVALKINLKMGGHNHTLVQRVNLFSKPGLMVAGYDVTHPTGDASTGDKSRATESHTEAGVKGPDGGAKQPKIQNCPSKDDGENKQSQGGLVVSADKELGQWFPYYWNQASRQEMTKGALRKAFEDRFEAWKSTNQGQQLLQIVIYRDGVSESQFGQILEQEVPDIRAAYSSVFPKSTPPQMTLVVAVKRHTTRFFQKAPKGCSNENVAPGTVVDNGVTQPKYWEFFLASHAAIQGTTRPTRYVVILDEIFENNYSQSEAADQLEKFTHQMSYMFGRATKAVGVCTPAYYADILCTRARAYMSALADKDTLSVIKKSLAKEKSEDLKKRVLDGDIHPDLKNSMYWI